MHLFMASPLVLVVGKLIIEIDTYIASIRVKILKLLVIIMVKSDELSTNYARVKNKICTSDVVTKLSFVNERCMNNQWTASLLKQAHIDDMYAKSPTLYLWMYLFMMSFRCWLWVNQTMKLIPTIQVKNVKLLVTYQINSCSIYI